MPGLNPSLDKFFFVLGIFKNPFSVWSIILYFQFLLSSHAKIISNHISPTYGTTRGEKFLAMENIKLYYFQGHFKDFTWEVNKFNWNIASSRELVKKNTVMLHKKKRDQLPQERCLWFSIWYHAEKMVEIILSGLYTSTVPKSFVNNNEIIRKLLWRINFGLNILMMYLRKSNVHKGGMNIDLKIHVVIVRWYRYHP